MTDLFSMAFSVVLYVLQALGLYTIAQRRGIRHAWLAWIPVGCIWIIGSIADDYKKKVQGKTERKRLWATLFAVLTAVLAFATMAVAFTAVLLPTVEIIGYEKLYKLAQLSTMDPNGMYGPVLEEYMAEMEQQFNSAISDEMVQEMTKGVLLMVGLLLVLMVVSVVSTVLQYMSLYSLFSSCEPRNKGLYLILSLVFGVAGVIIFMFRNRDDGMVPVPQGLPGNQQPPNYWQQM